MKKLSRIYIEITNVCNLSCSFCIGNVRPPRWMSTAEFADVLQQVKTCTDYIYLHVLGEPLLHPHLEAFLDMAAEANVRVNITTNGTLLAAQQEMLLRATALRKVSVSLHSLESSEGAEEYLRHVAAFAVAAAEQGIICDLRLWNLSAADTNNVPIFDQLCRLFQLDHETEAVAKAKIGESGSMPLMEKIYLGTAPRFEWPSMDAMPTNKPVFCHGLRNQAAILCDGTVVPCCLDSRGDIPLGNVFERPLGEILTGPRGQAIYEGFSARRPSEELCRRCGYATRF